MPDRFRITKAWAQRFAAEKIVVPTLLRRAGLPAGLFEQEKIYITTAELFALWRSVAEMSPDPGFGLKLGTELRFERSHPVAIAGVCSRTFGDALQRLARYKQLTCPEEIRVHRKAQETSVEIFFIEAKEAQPDIMVDLGLSWILNVGRRGTDGEITPLRLELTRPVKHRALLESHFDCRVRFKADRNALVFRSSDLDRPFVTYNEELVRVIGTQLDSELKARSASAQIGEQVKDIVSGVIDIYYNRPFEIPAFETIAVSPEVLDQYVGVYSSPDAPAKFTITRDGGTLFVQPGSESAAALEATAPDKFQLFGGKVTFEFDAAKKQMILKRGGRPMAFTKEK